MNTNHDALREAFDKWWLAGPYGKRPMDLLDEFITDDQAFEIWQAALSQPMPAQPQAQTTSPDDIHSCGEFCDLPECVAAREAQAQGEPEVVAYRSWADDLGYGLYTSRRDAELNSAVDFDPEDLITLQSHREAIAKHRAALEKCVEALEESVDLVRHEYETDWRHGIPTRKAQLDGKKELLEAHAAAINHANQVLGRKEGGK